MTANITPEVLSAHDHGNCELCDQIERDLAAANAEREELRKDAERYRQHLKGCWWDCEIETSFAAYELEQRVIDDDWWKQDGAEIDAAIAAREKP